jgi:hypothetical protein
MLGHHHCLILVECSDLTATEDGQICCAGKCQPATLMARAAPPNHILGKTACFEEPELALRLALT